MCVTSNLLPPNAPTPANKCDVSHNKRPRLLSQLPLPYGRFTCRSPSVRSCSETHRVFPRPPDRVESEHSSDIRSDVTSDLTNVTFDMTDISLVPPSSVLKNRKQGNLRVVRGRVKDVSPCPVLCPSSSGSCLVLLSRPAVRMYTKDSDLFLHNSTHGSKKTNKWCACVPCR